MDSRILWRAALVQLAAVAALSVALGLALPHDFFVDWGWIAGPGSWLLCAAFTARVLGLPLAPALLGAGLAGLPSLIAVLIDLHWAGAVLAVTLFALWCGWLASRNTPLPPPLVGSAPQANAGDRPPDTAGPRPGRRTGDDAANAAGSPAEADHGQAVGR